LSIGLWQLIYVKLKNTGGIDNILSDFFKLHLAQSIQTFWAVNDVPPFEKGKSRL